MPAMAQHRRRDTSRALRHPRRAGRIQPRGVGGGQQQAGESLGVGETVRRDPAEIGEDVLEGHPAQAPVSPRTSRSEEHTSELQSLAYLVCRLLLEKKKKQ